jgi:hypothetical protein
MPEGLTVGVPSAIVKVFRDGVPDRHIIVSDCLNNQVEHPFRQKTNASMCMGSVISP